MEEVKGTNIPAAVVPFTSDDKYPTHSEEYGRGGYRTVNSISEMNAIPAERRKEGMLVNVKNDKIYILKNGSFVDAGLSGCGGNWNSGFNLSKNGYQRFDNGLMIQWGYATGSITYPKIVYMPTSFYDTNYIVSGSIIKNSTNSNVYTFCPINSFSVSSFSVDGNFASTTNINYTTWGFNWIAIGRWK